MDLEKERLDWADKLLARQLDWIGRYDTKSTLLLGICTAMLGALFSVTPKLREFNDLLSGSTLITLLLLAGALLFLVFAQFPRTREGKGAPKSSIFFGSIAGQKSAEFVADFQKRAADEHLCDLLWQTHRNAEIVQSKFCNLQVAYICFGLSLVPWSAAIYLAKGGTL